MTKCHNCLFDCCHLVGVQIVWFMFEKEHPDITKPGIKFLGVCGVGGMGMANLYNAFCNQFQSDFQGEIYPVILYKNASRTSTGIQAHLVQIHSKQPLPFQNEEQVLRTCLQEGSFPIDNSSPKQYQVVGLERFEPLLYADHTDNNLSRFSQVSQNVYDLPLLQGSR